TAGGRVTGGWGRATAEPPADQLAYFDRVVTGAKAGGADLVTWWSNRDVVPADFMTSCPCTFDATWCAIIAQTRAQAGGDGLAQFYPEMSLKIFGTMGPRDHTRSPRPGVFARREGRRPRPPPQR